MHCTTLALTSAFVAASLLTASLRADVRYTFTDLGTLPGGSESYAYGLNNLGQVVGNSGVNVGNFNHHAFLYSAGVMTDLGTFVGALDTASQSYARAINDAGQIVGYGLIPIPNTGSVRYHAAHFTGSAVQDLGTLGGVTSFAYALNDAGQTVGDAELSLNAHHAFLSAPNASAPLADLGLIPMAYQYGGSYGYAVNNLGQVAGVASDPAGRDHAFLYVNGAIADLGTLGGYYSTAWDLNDHTEIVGAADSPVGTHAFLYAAGVMHDLGTLGGPSSTAYGINTAGQIVGYSETADRQARHAFLYADGAMIDLNTLIPPDTGYHLLEATAINDVGQIIGYALTPDARYRAFVLTPTPEPASLSLLAFAATPLLPRRRRR